MTMKQAKQTRPVIAPGTLLRVKGVGELPYYPRLMICRPKPKWSELDFETITKRNVENNTLFYENFTDLKNGDILMVLDSLQTYDGHTKTVLRHLRVIYEDRVGDIVCLRKRDWAQHLRPISMEL